MRKFIFGFIWLVSFVLLMVVCDQFLLRYPGESVPLLSDFQHFYKDVRQRVGAVLSTNNEHTVKQVIGQRLKEVSSGAKNSNTGTAISKPRSAVDAGQDSAHYVYLDEQQTLNFADSLEEIPPALRSSAKKLDN